MLADHAPTAVLAARTLGIPVMLFSNGFTVPPHVRPLPNMRPWQPIPEAPLLALEDAALASVNAVLADSGHPSLDALCRLFDVAEETLITFPELDHYDGRGPARYWGSLPSAGGGVPVEMARHPRFPPLRLSAPRVPPPRGAAFRPPRTRPADGHLLPGKAGGAPGALRRPPSRLSRPAGRRRADGPRSRRGDHLFEPRDHDGLLFAGKPLLLLPWHLEQFLLARRVGEMGAALVINPEQPADDLRTPRLRLLNEPSEPGEQYYERFVTASTQIKKINTPILMNATDALQLAHKALKFAWNAKICRFSVGSEHLHLSPTDVVTIDRTEASHRVMLMESRRHRLLTQWQGIVEGMTYTWGEEVLLEVDQWVIT